MSVQQERIGNDSRSVANNLGMSGFDRRAGWRIAGRGVGTRSRKTTDKQQMPNRHTATLSLP